MPVKKEFREKKRKISHQDRKKNSRLKHVREGNKEYDNFTTQNKEINKTCSRRTSKGGTIKQMDFMTVSRAIGSFWTPPALKLNVKGGVNCRKGRHGGYFTHT